MSGEKPIRLRDFVADRDGWLYAVSAYDNADRVGCVLRYVPDEQGARVDPAGRRYTKYDFEEAYAYLAAHKPGYLDGLHRIPHEDITRVYKPEEELEAIAGDDLLRLAVRQPISRGAAMGTINLCRMATLVARSALLRRESRGPHFRSDFPQEGGTEYQRWLVWHARKGSTPTSSWELPGGTNDVWPP